MEQCLHVMASLNIIASERHTLSLPTLSLSRTLLFVTRELQRRCKF